MRITKSRLRKIIQEEVMKLAEDHISDELDNLRKNVDDDKDHIDNLEKDIEDDREEMERAHHEDLEHEKEKHESRRIIRNRLRKIKREEQEPATREALKSRVAKRIRGVSRRRR